MTVRTAHPSRDLDVIDARAPRTNQAVMGSLALLAFVLDLQWLPAILALQLAIGLTFGRQYCLPCLFYFEVIQPRFGEGRIEDARPPRFANMIGLAFLGSATLAFVAGVPALGWTLALIVAALALLAASTGLCLGCEAYMLLARLRGLRIERYPGARPGRAPERVDPDEIGLDGSGVGVVGFSTPYCLPCRLWEAELSRVGIDFVKVDVAERPELAQRYAVRATPLVLAVDLPDGRVIEAYDDAPRPGEVERLAGLVATGVT